MYDCERYKESDFMHEYPKSWHVRRVLSPSKLILYATVYSDFWRCPPLLATA
jgi:hypothetical protein